MSKAIKDPITAHMDELRALKQRIQDFDNVMNGDDQSRDSRPPNGDDYNALHSDIMDTLARLGV